MDQADLVIVGAGAAGLMTAITAGRTASLSGRSRSRIIILDGAQKIGAKILVAGGGRCNVTHEYVDAGAFAGSSRNAINKVLKRFDVPQTIEFFRKLGVELKREETGKLFPVTDSAKTVLNALLGAVRDAGVDLRFPRRVDEVVREGNCFHVAGGWGRIRTPRIVLTTGGMSLPKTGSDGHGYEIARSLGHTTTSRIFPALVPLTLPKDHFICSLSGVTFPATLTLRSRTGKHLVSFTDSTLCTHFGLSGPSVLDISRYWVDAREGDPNVELAINCLPGKSEQEVDELILEAGHRGAVKVLSEFIPQRLAEALCRQAKVVPATACRQLRREQRRALVRTVTQCVLPVTGNRGYLFAEVTAGGIPLAEIDLKTMESRRCSGLYLAGEICDVDGRIGGFNFQWAWSSGYTAGCALGRVISHAAGTSADVT